MRFSKAPVIAFFGLVPAALLGCGNVDSGSGVPIENAAMQAAQTICPKAWSCCTASQLAGNSNAGTDETSCETATAQAFQNQLNAIQASQNAGRAKYDGDKVDACLKTIRSSDCQKLDMTNHLSGVAGCDSFVKPLVAYGGACSQDFECIDGYCSRAPNMSGDGTCQAFSASGAACSDQVLCGSGLTCDATSNTCVTAPPVTPPANACFYSSGCNIGGGSPRGLFALALALAAIARGRAKRR
jgi:hypothetical protein